MKILPILTSVLFFLGVCASSFAQKTVYKTGAESAKIHYLGKTKTLSAKTAVAPPNNNQKKKALKSNWPKAPQNFKDDTPMPSNYQAAQPQGEDPLRQIPGFNPLAFPVEPILNFDGIDVVEAQNIGVPDTNGDVSPEHYIQITNGGGSTFKIFDKEGNLLLGPVSLNSFWEDFGMSGLGDPVVLYDQGADRWLFSEIASDFATMLVAISETNDPFGAYYAYQFLAPFGLPDYPKYGVWPDAYYVTTNEGGDEIPVYAFDRAAMLNGEANVEMQRLGIPKFETGGAFAFQVATAADWDGINNAPLPGTPQYVVRMYDDAWDGGSDKLEVWEISLDWNNSNNSTVSGPIEIPVSAFDSDVCNGDLFNCLQQSNGELISALQQVIMHRVNYRNFGTHESMVLNHVVDVSGNSLAGVRWYELRKPAGGEWGLYQEGTVGADENHRFMGSIAIDASGSIGLAYSVMGPNQNLSLRYTGRRASDPLGEMTVDEYEFATGLSLHLNNPRWGDYSMMTVDEDDGRTFWYTGEYMKANNQWGTKIVTFILKRDTIDIGPSKLLTPQNSAYLTDMEPVEIEVKNFGLEPQWDFEVGYIFENGMAVVEMVPDTLQPDSVYTHLFSPTVDMSVIGDYEFKIFTTLVNDQNVLNDTLRQIVSKTTRFDAGISDVVGLAESVCDSTVDIIVTLTNFGAEELTSVDVIWDLNAGGAGGTIPWTGSLQSGESATLNLNLMPLIAGNNTFTVSTANPNGEIDEDMANDGLSRDFNVELEGGFVQLQLLTDLYPNETTWQLADDMGNVLYFGGPFASTQTLFEENWCLGEGCYVFTLFDSWGDGIQAQGVEGDYTITDENGVILASLMEANFGFSETAEFCVPFVCALEAVVFTTNESDDNALDGVINIVPSNGLAPFEYSIDGGNSFQSQPVFDGLPGGTYNVVVSDANGCTTEEEVEVITCLIQFSAEVVNPTTIDLQSGSITITASSGNTPYEYSINNGIDFQSSNLFENLPAGMYDVIVLDALGCRREMTITLETLVNATELVLGQSVEVFPNPTNGIFLIKVKGLVGVEKLDAEIIDSAGKVVQRGKLAAYNGVLSSEFSLYNYPAGVYYVRLKHGDFKQLVSIIRK